MSQKEQDPEVDVAESPEPEDEADLPAGAEEPEGHTVRSQEVNEGQGSEVDVTQEFTNGEGLDCEGQSAEAESLNPSCSLGAAQCGENQNSNSGVDGLSRAEGDSQGDVCLESDDNVYSNAALRGEAEADRFEQDEAMAAPESEAGVCDVSAIESDRDIAGHNNGTLRNDHNNEDLDELPSGLDIGVNSEQNICGESVSQCDRDESVNVCESSGKFSGDVEVSSSLEDAPEAEMESLGGAATSSDACEGHCVGNAIPETEPSASCDDSHQPEADLVGAESAVVEACEGDCVAKEISDEQPEVCVSEDSLQHEACGVESQQHESTAALESQGKESPEGANSLNEEENVQVPECDREIQNQQEYQEYLKQNPEFLLEKNQSVPNDNQDTTSEDSESVLRGAEVCLQDTNTEKNEEPIQSVGKDSVSSDSSNVVCSSSIQDACSNSDDVSNIENSNYEKIKSKECDNKTNSELTDSGCVSDTSSHTNASKHSNDNPSEKEESAQSNSPHLERVILLDSAELPDTPSDNGSVESSPDLNDSRVDSYQKKLAEAMMIHDDEEEDDILSQLNAELNSKTNGVSVSTKVEVTKNKQTKGKRQEKLVNGLEPSLVLHPSPEVNQLESHNRQLLEQLKLRDGEIFRLSEESNRLKDLKATDSSHSAEDVYLPQIKEMEKALASMQTEVKVSRDKLMAHDSQAKKTITSLQNELKARVDQVTKKYDDTRREKDSMVIRFAEAEAKTLSSKRTADKWEAKVKDVLREKEVMMREVKQAKADKQKAVSDKDAKNKEVSGLNKEIEKVKEAVNSADYRIKWFQNKLKDELENHKNTKEQGEKTTARLKEAREETEMIRQQCQDIVKRYQESEEIKSNSLDKELKMKESELKMQMQERTDTEEIAQMTKRELDSLKNQHKDTLEEAKTYKDKVTCLDEERQQNHNMIERYQEIMQRQKTENVEYKAKADITIALEQDFARAQDMIKSLDKEVSELKSTKRDLQRDTDGFLERESKMLTLQSELSRSNAMLRSENTSLTNKATIFAAEVERMKMDIQDLEATVKDLTEKYGCEKTKRKDEVDRMAAALDQANQNSSDFKQKWEDEQDNGKTLKRRHANNVKDLTRQLQQVRRRLEAMEGHNGHNGREGSMGSRTNSNVSLNSIDASHGQSQAPLPQAPIQEYPVITEQVEIDKNVLVERIVKLQKSLARKNEKLEFLTEHITQLVEEIKRKNKVIQTYVMREEAGTLSSEMMDQNKSLLAGKGGIMASMYSLHQQDGHMTLDLSLQINAKLQAVLEDTLLKNITLKENFDTLGEEIARLSQDNRKLQLRLQDLERKEELPS